MISSTTILKKQIKSLGTNVGIAAVLALTSVAIYLAFSIQFAKTQRSIIDEGLYLYKGYLYAIGSYHPFQDYGPRTEYGPFAYLVPGAIQLWFGPSLRTGRIFAIIVGVLALLGLWAASRRLAGPWWAAAAVWAAALNPAAIRFYSFGTSQGLVACLLMWTLYFALGKNRSIWQTSLSAVLASLLLLTRQNMAPVLPVLLVYIFWQYGRKQGLIGALAGAILVIATHVVFWPGILGMWAPWLPTNLTPFLNAWRLPEGVTPAMNFHSTWSARLDSLLEGIRFHFVALVGSIAGLIFWPARKAWKSEHEFRSGAFLAILFFLLLVFHLYAGLGFGGINFNNAYTVNPYLAFFAYLGLLFSIAVFSNFQWHLSRAKQIIIGLLIVFISTGIGNRSDLYVPRIRSFLTTGKILPGYVPLWEYFGDKFGIPYDISHWLIPSLAGLLMGLFILLTCFVIWFVLKRRRLLKPSSYGAISAVIFMVAGIMLSPSSVLGGGFNQWACPANVINAFEETGRYLAEHIPAGSTVFWRGGNAVPVLLYTPGITIYPAQIDWEWNHWNGGNPDLLARLGFWNDNMSTQWLENADVAIIQVAYEKAFGLAIPDLSAFVEIGKTSQGLNCSQDSVLQIYRKR